MKLTVERDALHAAIQRAAKIVARPATIPILANILLDAAEDRLVLRACDLDMEVETSVPARVAAPGALTAPGELLGDIVARAPAGAQMAFDVEDGRLAVKFGRVRAALNTLAAQDFPRLSADGFTYRFEMDAEAFGLMLAKTEFAVPNNHSRFVLNGLHLAVVADPEGAKLHAVATDGVWLALYETQAPQGVEGMPPIIVPAKAIGELRRLTKGVTGPLAVAVSESKFAVTLPGGTRVLTKLIDATYPDYLRVIPTSASRIAIVDRAQAAAALGRVTAFADDRERKLKLSFRDGCLQLSSIKTAAGDILDEIEAEWEGLGLDIGFNGRYLAEIFSVLGGDTARIELIGPASPAVLRTSAEAPLKIVLMPMRL